MRVKGDAARRIDKQGCRRLGTETLAGDEGYEALVEEERPLSNGAAPGRATIGIDGGGRLGCSLGLGEEAEEGDEGIH
jgi:hypothetical protein